MVNASSLMTADGRRVAVLFPGRESSGSGPDFRDAIVRIGDSGRLRGDVEVHVRSRDWQAHGHDRDREYNGVILHVVMWDSGAGFSVLQNGRRVPVLALHPHVTAPLEDLSSLHQRAFAPNDACCSAAERHGTDDVIARLGAAGDERFRMKTSTCVSRLDAEGPEEVLYRGIMRGLGYEKNTGPMEELASRLPLNMVREISGLDPRRLGALMLGVAGLLPSLRFGGLENIPQGWGDTETARMEKAWADYGIADRMEAAAWRLSGIRPENLPARRIVAAGFILSRCGGAPGRWAVRVARSETLGRAQLDLEHGLTVKVTGYWARHYDFGIASRVAVGLVGRYRAREIIVNAVLPWLAAVAGRYSVPWLERRSWEAYAAHPPLQQNWITKYLARKALGSAEAAGLSARHQQGLIHIHRTYCIERRCGQCPLG